MLINVDIVLHEVCDDKSECFSQYSETLLMFLK